MHSLRYAYYKGKHYTQETALEQQIGLMDVFLCPC